MHNNGLSPSGKAPDSDSGITGVRIPQAQLDFPSLLIQRGVFVVCASAILKEDLTMIKLGEVQTLEVVKIVDFGVYLGSEDEKVLLPKKQVPEGSKVGDSIEVFIYKDSSDRLIATVRAPKLTVGQMAVLKVNQVTRIGAFLDWGLEKDLFLPFKEQLCDLKPGDEYLVALYVDKSDRLAATMRVYNYLTEAKTYVKDSAVTARVIQINPEMGVYLAIDDKYFGMLGKNEVYSNLKLGDIVYGRVSKVREDGKLDVSLKQKAYIQMDEDSEIIIKKMQSLGGALPYTDKSVKPETIRKDFDMSKNEFKRAIGKLLKEKRITIESDSIKIVL